MSTSIEQIIKKLLVQHDEAIIVADELLKMWDRGEFSFAEQNHVALFIIQAGFYPTVINQIKKNISKKQRIPWAALLEILGMQTSKPTKDVVDQILIGAAEEDALNELLYTKKLDFIDGRFKKLRKKLSAELVKEFEEKKRDLINQANILKQDGLHEEEQQIIEKIKNLDPQDKTIERRTEDASLVKIRDLLLRKESELFGRDLQFSEEKVDAQTAQSFVDAAIADSDNAYEISIALYQMGCYKESLAALDNAKPSTAKDWLRIELLHENKLFLEVLTELNHIEVKYADDAETFYSSLIFKAKALWGLGEKESAILILEKMLKERPSHITAQTLLREWKAFNQ